MNLPPEIFKAYDIRGIVGKTLTPAIGRRNIGRSIGSEAARARRLGHRDRARRAPVGPNCPARWPPACRPRAST